jgi:hypothetical protein
MSRDVTRRPDSPVSLNMSAVVDRSLTEASVAARPTALQILVAAPIAGAALGVLARGWMRLLADDPEFTVNGTVFIVLAFTIAGAGHGAAWGARRAGMRRRWTTPARVLAAVLTLPIFTGAGAMMLPTVVGASLATARTDWHRYVRVLAALVAIPVPVMLAVDLVDDGVTPGNVLGFVLLGGTYTVIIRSCHAVVSPIDDGWRIPRFARIWVVIALILFVFLVASFAMGIATADA